MDLSGPDAIDKAIAAGIDLDGSPLPGKPCSGSTTK